jgi:acyl carrier protein
MEKREYILQELTAIFRKELEDDNLQLTYASSANSVEQWDSITNLMLISAIEERFNISFPIEFIFKAENVGDLCDYLLDNAIINN